MNVSPAAVDAPRITLSIALIALIFAASGVLHLVKPQPYVSIMPPWLPAPLALVIVSGICEIAGAAGILLPFTRVAAGWGLIALLLAVFPANIQMLINARAAHASSLWTAGLVARLPLQVLLIIWVYRSTIVAKR
ncbi:MAG: DoxX family protein [Gemmatimonadota bacterium]|nr:DoxX family protein [Gemmatimonadota bacterium]